MLLADLFDGRFTAGPVSRLQNLAAKQVADRINMRMGVVHGNQQLYEQAFGDTFTSQAMEVARARAVADWVRNRRPSALTELQTPYERTMFTHIPEMLPVEFIRFIRDRTGVRLQSVYRDAAFLDIGPELQIRADTFRSLLVQLWTEWQGTLAE